MAISPTANRISGLIAYEVTIVPQATQAPLRAGMSATAVITTAQVNNAVLLSNRFIQIDHQTKQAFVYKMVNQQTVLQKIQFGLRTDTASQVLTAIMPKTAYWHWRTLLAQLAAHPNVRQFFHPHRTERYPCQHIHDRPATPADNGAPHNYLRQSHE
ncbi:hypothetical protein BH10CHL1_BH10CHL1_16440 [soil metagenome]